MNRENCCQHSVASAALWPIVWEQTQETVKSKVRFRFRRTEQTGRSFAGVDAALQTASLEIVDAVTDKEEEVVLKSFAKFIKGFFESRQTVIKHGSVNNLGMFLLSCCEKLLVL